MPKKEMSTFPQAQKKKQNKKKPDKSYHTSHNFFFVLHSA